MDPIQKIDDPRITAYAFGELEGDELAAAERFVVEHPEARAAVDELRALGDGLRDELSAESAPRLSAAQRDAIRAAASGDGDGASDAGATSPVLRMRPMLRYAAAAAVLILATAALFSVPRMFGDSEASTFRYELFGASNKPAPAGEAAQFDRDGYTSQGSGSQVARGGGSARSGELAAMGYLKEPTLGEAEQLALESLGYLGTSEPSQEPQRNLQTGPVPRTSTAGAVVLRDRAATAGVKPSSAARSAAASPAVSGSTNSNAGEFFDDEGDQVFAATSRDFFDAAADRGDYEAAKRLASREGYAALHDNPFVTVVPGNPLTRLSTFGVDVDRASYANVRRFLQRNQLPPADAVRLEELVNAFEYADAAPASDSEVPFAVHVSSAAAPWAPQHRLVRVALKGRVIEQAERPAAQLTFLVDVSGSMQSADKLPLLKQSLRLLVEQLDERDQVALVTYASGSRVVLPSTPASDKAAILGALDSLTAGGSTNGSGGLQLAYETAEAAALGDDGEQGTRRVLLCTDGDFNVGVTSQQGLHDLIAKRAEGGTFLTVLGFGTGNYQDRTAETLADRGNGQYAYIDGLDEAHHVLVRQLTGTLVTIAQDVKLQLEFNPAHARAWRQLGYENRQMAAQDFRNDRKDAGEIGAGHSVVAYYEVVPTGVPLLTGTAELKYDAPSDTPVADDGASPELLTVNLRWKQPGSKPEDPADEFSRAFVDGGASFAESSADFRFGAAVLEWGMALRGSPHRGQWPLAMVAKTARKSRGADPDGERAKFVDLVLRALGLLPASESQLTPAQLEELEMIGYSGPGDDGSELSDEDHQTLCDLGYIDCR